MKYVMIWVLALFLAPCAVNAATVQLNDGSSLSGEITEQANGDVVVKTGAGDVTVVKDKIRAIVKDGSASAEGDMSYVDKVLKRRKKYGNEDGLSHAQNLHAEQWLFTVGQLSNVGDAFLVKDNATGATLLSAADIAGLSFGLAWAHSYTDYVAVEVWGDYSGVVKDYTVASVKNEYKLQRYNVGLGPKIQFARHIGDAEGGFEIIPNIGISPVWSGANGSNGGVSFNSSSIGAAITAGLDLQFGGALIAIKGRYLLTSDVTGGLKNNNTSAFLPQIGAGWAF